MKKCRICKTPFVPRFRMQPVCENYECKVAFALQVADRAARKREKVERANDRIKREQLKTRSQWMKEAQIAFNAYIRERDKDQPCICCGLPLVVEDANSTGGSFDCGHYRSVGSAPNLRFNENNAHGQRKQCNRYGAGRAVDYRIGLIRRIGLADVEALESDNTPRHYTIDDLKAIKALYVQKRKDLIANRSTSAESLDQQVPVAIDE